MALCQFVGTRDKVREDNGTEQSSSQRNKKETPCNAASCLLGNGDL